MNVTTHKCNLSEKGACWAHSSRCGQSYWEYQVNKSVWSHCIHSEKQREVSGNMLSSLSPSPFYSVWDQLTTRKDPRMVRMVLPTSIDIIKKTPHRHVERHISCVSLDPANSAINTNQTSRKSKPMCLCDTHTLVVLAWSGAKGPKVYYVGTTQREKKSLK